MAFSSEPRCPHVEQSFQELRIRKRFFTSSSGMRTVMIATASQALYKRCTDYLSTALPPSGGNAASTSAGNRSTR